MKKVFTLLFCVVAMALSASASDFTLVERCINYLLNPQAPKTLTASSQEAIYDANHDGVISISDVTTMIDQQLAATNVQNAPSQDIDVEAIINEALESETGEPNIHDVNKAIEHNLNNHKK